MTNGIRATKTIDIFYVSFVSTTFDVSFVSTFHVSDLNDLLFSSYLPIFFRNFVLVQNSLTLL